MYRCNLKFYLEKIEMSQDKFAQLVGVSRQTINSICNYTSIPKIDLALKISKVLNIKVTDLFQLVDTWVL